MSLPIRPRFPSDRPLVDANNKMSPAWDYYFRNVQNQLPAVGEIAIGSTTPIKIDLDGRSSIVFLQDGRTEVDGLLHFPTLSGDITNDGLITTLKNVGTPISNGFVTITTDSKGRVIASSPVSFNGDITNSGLTTTLASVGTPVSNSLVKITTDGKGRVIATNPVIASDITSLVDNTYVNVSGDTMTGMLTVPNVQLNTTPPSSTAQIGDIRWNVTDQAMDVKVSNNVTVQVGQEQLVRILNNGSTNFVDLQAVRITGAQGNRLTADLAIATSDHMSAATIGIVTEPINAHQQGFATVLGLVRDVNTSAWNEGDPLYLSGTVPGGLTNIKPVAPIHMVTIGWVVRSHSVNGSIFVNITNGFEIEELHDVLITSPLNNDALVYDSASGLWKNKPQSGGGGGDMNPDGGFANSVYLPTQLYDGGSATG